MQGQGQNQIPLGITARKLIKVQAAYTYLRQPGPRGKLCTQASVHRFTIHRNTTINNLWLEVSEIGGGGVLVYGYADTPASTATTPARGIPTRSLAVRQGCGNVFRVGGGAAVLKVGGNAHRPDLKFCQSCGGSHQSRGGGAAASLPPTFLLFAGGDLSRRHARDGGWRAAPGYRNFIGLWTFLSLLYCIIF